MFSTVGGRTPCTTWDVRNPVDNGIFNQLVSSRVSSINSINAGKGFKLEITPQKEFSMMECEFLGGGLKYPLFSPVPVEMIQFDDINSFKKVG